MKKSIFPILISTLFFFGCNSHQEALKVLPNELSIADNCRNINKNFEYDCYDLISYKNSFAQIRLGIRALNQEAYEEAFNRFTFAQKKGNFYANSLLADMYNNGLFVPKNKDMVLSLLKDVDEVDPIAAYKLAFVYIEDKEYKKAIELLEFASLNNVKDAQYELYKIYSQGEITLVNNEKSDYWFEQYKDKTDNFISKIYGN